MITYLILLCVVEVILLFVLTEYEWGAAATASLVGFLAALQLYFNVDLLGFAKNFPIPLICGVVLYFVLGVAWSIFKWYWWVTKKADGLGNKEEYFKNTFWGTGSKTPEEKEKSWQKHVRENIPGPASEKARILRWMGYWPISAIWFVLNDFVREIFNHLYHRFAAIYQKISDAAINRILK